MGNSDSQFHTNAAVQSNQRMENGQRPMQQQMSTGNVVIINRSDRKILARVAYQKSAITSSNIQQFNKTMTDKSKKIGAKGKYKGEIGIPGIDADIALAGNYDGKNKKTSETRDVRDYKMVVSKFNEEGWIPISGGRQRGFAKQGQIVYISILDFITNKTVIHNWNTAGTHFVYDGQEFEEVSTNQSPRANQVVYAQQPTQVVYAQQAPAQPTQVVYAQQARPSQPQGVELQVGRTSTTKTQDEDAIITHNCCYYLFCCCILRCIWDILTCASCSTQEANDQNCTICKWLIAAAVTVVVIIIIVSIAIAASG